jgi:hypothetical protein
MPSFLAGGAAGTQAWLAMSNPRFSARFSVWRFKTHSLIPKLALLKEEVRQPIYK